MQPGRFDPELIIAIAAAVWGLFWIPLRAFARQGLDPAWATLAQFVVPLAILLPLAIARRRQRQQAGFRHLRTGLLIGSAVALYLESLLLTEVARSLILFYAMPAWGTILEVGLMGRPLTRWRALSLFLSLAGLLAILGLGDPLAGGMNLGDGMALLSGMLFALGAMHMRQTAAADIFEQVFAFFLYGSVTSLTLALLPLAALGRPPSLDLLLSLAPWLLLVAGGFLIPVMWGIYWGTSRVDPGRLGILLQLEAVVGIGSAALLAGEPFGLRQAAGAVLVISAGLVEVLGGRPRAGPAAERPVSEPLKSE